MLYPVTPLTDVSCAVCPVHFASSMTLIFSILTPIDVTAGPLKNSMTVLLVVLVVSFKGVNICDACATFPPTLTVFQTIDEFSDVHRAIAPSVLTAAM